jgi:hypothetical protein
MKIDDPMDACRREIMRVAALRKCTPAEVPFDALNNDVMMCAFRFDIMQPKIVTDGAWGAGSPRQVRTGEGYSRRVPDWDGFRRRLLAGLEA